LLTTLPRRCIYTYDSAHPVGGAPFTESDLPNYTGSFYSLTKGMVDGLASTFPKHTLTLRLRMPISDDLSHRNFVTKIAGYARVINVPNSVTILTDLLPVALEMSRRKVTGVFNFTNPGVISHNEVLDLYKQYIDPDFSYENFTEEEQNKVRGRVDMGKRGREGSTTASVLLAVSPRLMFPTFARPPADPQGGTLQQPPGRDPSAGCGAGPRAATRS
jgi:hypothetical protein